MFYLSQLLSAPVEDPQGARIGKVSDVLVHVVPGGGGQAESTHLSALLVEGQAGGLAGPWRVSLETVQWHESRLRLRIPTEQLATSPAESPQEISLAREVLDKQVIDIVRKKAVRVNDLCLSDDWQLLGIDNSTLGLVRRLAPSWLLGTKSKRFPSGLIPWEHIEVIGIQHLYNTEAEVPTAIQEQPVSTPSQPPIEERRGPIDRALPSSQQPPPRIQSGHLAELHPADIAEIVHQLTPEQGARLIERLDNETAADTMEEIDTERQRHILENIQAHRAADILEAMGPDEAADLLAKLPEEHAQELLNLMKPEESEEVQELLEYAENTAGGLMTTDYIVLNATKNVAEALEAVRANILEQDIRVAYIYCVADETQDESPLLGVVSLWDLLVTEPTQPLEELMETDLITVSPESDPRAVAEIIAKYNLLAVPVVSAEGFLQGVVTVDDALDVLLPAGRRRKPTRMY